MRQLKNIFGCIVCLLLSIFIVSTMSVGAQDNNSKSAQGLQISPTRVELNAEKGKTYFIKMNVTNVTASNLEYKSSISDFEASGETGSPKLLINEELTHTSSIRTWVSVISNFTLESRKSRKIIAQITIPNDAEPGGHYGAINFSGGIPEVKGTGVGLTASTGLLVLIRVDGDIREKASLASFYTAQNDKQNWFFEYGPINFVTRIKNEGNIHIKPIGKIQITDIFGNSIKTISVNDNESNVLPNSIRRFDSNFDKTWMFGLYTANLTLGYGSTGRAITSTITYWVIPYKIILAGLFILITFVYIVSRLIKMYNKHIITKSKDEEKRIRHKKNKS